MKHSTKLLGRLGSVEDPAATLCPTKSSADDTSAGARVFEMKKVERTQDRGDVGRNHCTFTGCLLQLWRKLGESALDVFVMTDSHDVVD